MLNFAYNVKGGKTMVKINIVFYSLYGHIYKMAEAVADGVKEIDGAEVKLYQVEETFTTEILEKMGATETKKQFADLPIATTECLEEADAIIFGTPTRYGMVPSQMQAFIDRTGGIWTKGALVDKLGSIFTSSGTQHGGQESTILGFSTVLYHHGMIIVGVPYSFKNINMTDKMNGGGPYGASTIAGDGRMPSQNELETAMFQGKRVAQLAKRLKCEK